MEREHMRVHEENKTEAGKVQWVRPDGPERWVVWSDKDGDGRTKMGMAGQRWGQPDKDGDGQTKMRTNPDITPPSKVQCPDAPTVKGEVLVGECGGTWQLTA